MTTSLPGPVTHPDTTLGLLLNPQEKTATEPTSSSPARSQSPEDSHSASAASTVPTESEQPGHDADAKQPKTQRQSSTKGTAAASKMSPSRAGLKVNQAAFIHKLYSMLEDASISHLISWTPTNDSFVILPGEEFSKVLSQYFKHTNVSSFVRQLNMYGFHKVNDTFHGNSTSGGSSSSESTQWEFKHGGDSFKRGNVESLRAIKRRTSRQSVVHRESVPLKSVSISVPSTPPGNGTAVGDYLSSGVAAQAPVGQPFSGNPAPNVGLPMCIGSINARADAESRLAGLEASFYTLQDMNYRLQSRSTILSDILRRTQADLAQIIDVIAKQEYQPSRKASNDSINKEPTKSATAVPPSSASGTFEIDLEKLRREVLQRSVTLAQLDENQIPMQPSITLQQQRPSLYSYPHAYPKSEISFGMTKERAASVFYDPLQIVPADDNKTKNRQSAPGLLLSNHSSNPTSPAPNGPPNGTESNQQQPPFYFQSYHQQSSITTTGSHHPPVSNGAPPTQPRYPPYGFETQISAAPLSFLPSREQRPGSFPMAGGAYNSERKSNSLAVPSARQTLPSTSRHVADSQRRHTSGDVNLGDVNLDGNAGAAGFANTSLSALASMSDFLKSRQSSSSSSSNSIVSGSPGYHMSTSGTSGASVSPGQTSPKLKERREPSTGSVQSLLNPMGHDQDAENAAKRRRMES